MAIDPKQRRLQILPDKIAKFVTLPDTNDWIPFRDANYYTQFSGETYLSNKWPDLHYGASEHDCIRVNIYGDDDALIMTHYLLNNEFNSQIDSDLGNKPHIQLDPGKILRDLGFRRGRFRLSFSFFRHMFGSPFPLLVNGEEKIYSGGYEEDSETSHLFSTDEHTSSNTLLGDRLYVKEDKAVVTRFSADRTEIILSPNFVNESGYLERFRTAAYTCLNDFNEEGQTATFPEGEDSNLIGLAGYDEIPRSFINGTIRINDAYFLGKRVIPALEASYVVEPTLTTQVKTLNLLRGRYLDSTFNWKTHGPYPEASSVNSLSGANPNLMTAETVVHDTPVGNQAVKVAFQTTEVDMNRTSANRSLSMSPPVKIYRPVKGQEMTFSVYFKGGPGTEGSKIRLLAHAGPWGNPEGTKYSPSFEVTEGWQRAHFTFILGGSALSQTDEMILLRIINDPNGKYNSEIDDVIGMHFFYTGAQLELGNTLSEFTRNEDESTQDIQVAEAGTIRFADPENSDYFERRRLIADLNPTDDPFTQKMKGNQILIKDAITIDDLSSFISVEETDHKEIINYKDSLMPREDYSIPGSYQPVRTINDIEIGWNNQLHSNAILVEDQYGRGAWTSGFNYFHPFQKYSETGTAEIGYQPHWIYNPDDETETCMYFPDLNYVDEILNARKAAALETWNDPDIGYYASRGLSDPRIDGDYVNKEWWKHRYQAISTDVGGMTGQSNGIGSLAAYGAKPGDTVRVSWQQKAIPANPTFDEGGRKGAHVNLRHYREVQFTSPDPPDILASEVREEMVSLIVDPEGALRTNSDFASKLLDNDFIETNRERPQGSVGGLRTYRLAKTDDEDSSDPLGGSLSKELVSSADLQAAIDSDPNRVNFLYRAGENGNVYEGNLWATDGILGIGDFVPLQAAENGQGKLLAASCKPSATTIADAGYGESFFDDEADVPTQPKPVPYYFSDEGEPTGNNTTDWIWDTVNNEYVPRPEHVANGWVYDDITRKWFRQGAGIGGPTGLIIPALIQIGTELYLSEALGWAWSSSGWRSIAKELLGDVFYNSYNSPGYTGTYSDLSAGDYIVSSNNNQTYPSIDFVNNDKTTSPDQRFVWKGNSGWVLFDSATSDGELQSNADGTSTFSYLSWTDILTTNPDGTAASYSKGYVPCHELDEWEEANFDFVIPEDGTFGLYRNTGVTVYGHKGGFGELWVKDVRVDILLTSNQRTKVDQTAKLGPLVLTIADVVGNNELIVTEEYDEAAEGQGRVVANIPVNKYTTFGSGFEIGYTEEDEEVQTVMGRYEGKILDVVQNQYGPCLIVNKTYREYGGEINAISGSSDSINPVTTNFDQFFIRHRLKDSDNLYTRIVFGPEEDSLVVNFKPVNVTNYPGSIAYKLLEPAPDTVQQFDTAYIVTEATPDLEETVTLEPFIDEVIPETVLKAPKLDEVEPVINKRETAYRSHTDLVGVETDTRKQLEDKIFSGSLLDVSINVDYTNFENFSHFGSVSKRLENYKTKLTNIESHVAKSQSYASISASANDQEYWDMKKREIINGFDDFENYMYFNSSSYVSSSNGIEYSNASPKRSGDGTLTSPYVLYSVTSSNFTSWYDEVHESASAYDNTNTNRLVNLTPAHVTYDEDNEPFVRFMDMLGHHYDIIWTHIKHLTDVHDRSEDITKGISAQLVQPVAESMGFKMLEGRDLARLPQYHLGLSESGSGTGVYSVRYTKKSQQDVTREIWNRILSTMPYILKTKGTKQSLKALIAAYGIPTSILRIQEYGGPKISGGSPEFELTQRYTYALDLKGSQTVASPWYKINGKANDTIELRFKTETERDTMIATKNDSNNKVESAIYIENVSGSDTKGKLAFSISSSEGFVSASLQPLPVYNGEYWSVMVRRRSGASTLTSSYSEMFLTSDANPTTQSFDIFAGFYDSSTDEIIKQASSSITLSGSNQLAAWYQTSSIGDNYWHIGGKTQTSEEATLYGSKLTGSLMEWRLWSTPLTASAFWNHVAAPKALNGNHESSSYYDMNLRFSMDDKINLSSGESPKGIKDYSLTGDQVYATASAFADEINFSSVSDRQKAFVPSIGLNKTSNKIRIEGKAKTIFTDGTDPVLSSTERIERGSYDTAPLDSNKLGIFFAPSDVINEDIILSLADLDFGSYMGDPRDMYADRYVHGRLDRISDTYWQKWTTKFNFWDYLKLIKYYDLSLFDHLRRLSPGRAKKNIGILIEPTILERPKAVVGKKPLIEDITKKVSLDAMEHYSQSAEQIWKEDKIRHVYNLYPTSSNLVHDANVSGSTFRRDNRYIIGEKYHRRRGITDMLGTRKYTGSREDHLKTFSWSFDEAVSLVSGRHDYKTVSSSTNPFFTEQLRSFSYDNLLDPKDNNYVDNCNVHTGGGSNVFFEILQPTATGSVTSLFNDKKIYHYSSSVSKSQGLWYSSSLEKSDQDSLFTTHTGLFNLAYGGCQEDGSTVPEGNLVAVEITEVNPYSVTTTTSGDTYVDVSLDQE
tara:strand:+ start:4528 stop:11994 length:7467 start_codon:yes stop_codon:yes gene_type:complete